MKWCSKATVESNPMCRVQGQFVSVGQGFLLGEFDNSDDLLGIFKTYLTSAFFISSARSEHTGIFGFGDDFSKKLGKVWKVFLQKFGLKHDILAGVVCVEDTTKKLSFSCDPYGASLRCRLR